MSKEFQTRVEKIIVKNGFKRTQELSYYSSIIPDGVRSTYVKDEIEVVVGLHEKGHPPTLIYPRHIVITKRGNTTIGRLANDSEINEMIINMTDQEILNYIYLNQKKR